MEVRDYLSAGRACLAVEQRSASVLLSTEGGLVAEFLILTTSQTQPIVADCMF